MLGRHSSRGGGEDIKNAGGRKANSIQRHVLILRGGAREVPVRNLRERSKFLVGKGGEAFSRSGWKVRLRELNYFNKAGKRVREGS